MTNRALIILLGRLVGVVVLGFPVMALAERDYPPPPDHDYEKVCEDIDGTVQIIECLGGHLSDAKDNLDNVISLLTKREPADSEEKEYRASFLAAHETWRKDIQKTCWETQRLRYGLGSMSRTEPIRCAYVMTKERERLLRLLYYKALKYLETRDK